MQLNAGHLRKRLHQFKEAEGGEDARRAAVIKRLQAPPASCLPPVFPETDAPNSKIIHRAMAMRGRSAIEQVCKLQQSNRNSQIANIREALIDKSLSGNIQKAALEVSISALAPLNSLTFSDDS